MQDKSNFLQDVITKPVICKHFTTPLIWCKFGFYQNTLKGLEWHLATHLLYIGHTCQWQARLAKTENWSTSY